MNEQRSKLGPGDFFERIGILIFLVILVLSVQIPLGVIARTRQIKTATILLGIAYLAIFIVVILIARFFYRRYGKVTPKPFTWADLRLVLIGFVVMLAAEVILGMVNQQVYGVQQTSNNEVIAQLLSSNRLTLVLLMISSVCLSPILEELVFRGFLISSFFDASSRVWPVVVSAVLFAIPHMEDLNIISFLTYASMGAVLAYLYNHTKNIKVSIALHFLNNLYAMLGMVTLLLTQH
ncbi:CPBP family intramembrane glutamic endopeptidase [Lentilactobacillus sp. SPB1-3]|uniref:Lysostaphin resistance A-like protein n=1 Tax=Lentilactobacillus terminaliae TaxID=3003483 RepID=A0ACD5DH39_9LACO|nr:type II CAAX endopeptidase family protein [Lentilactobacillus sp. SPB1-3]MCZ0977026.1 type II CAAX endopeptidase family protein [Lentilactobacillus sp. SPB1-3]